jgi:hypothetical protein
MLIVMTYTYGLYFIDRSQKQNASPPPPSYDVHLFPHNFAHYFFGNVTVMPIILEGNLSVQIKPCFIIKSQMKVNFGALN